MGVLKIALAALALLVAACFEPEELDGSLRCGPGGTCPGEFSCGSDGRCWRSPPALDAALPDALPPDARLPACSNGIDDDCDGKIDRGDDPGCSSNEDDDEHGTKRCDDGIDNDSDGFTDFHVAGCGTQASDPQCEKPDEDNES